MIDGPLFALVVIATAFVISGVLYDRQGDKSTTVSATFGLVGNIVYTSAAVFLILGGGSSAFVGFILLIAVWFMARGNIETLRESKLRAKIAGQA